MSNTSVELSEREANLQWSPIYEQATHWLQDYLRFPTVNDPLRLTLEERETSPWLAGREAEAAQWLAGILTRERIPVELLESAPGRANVVARLRAVNPQNSPIILLSHSDVVPVSHQKWDPDVDPFSGTIRDGYIYGRGALDLKGLGIAHLMILILLHRLQIPLKRDVILLVVADEEAGGHYGAQWMLQQRPELLKAGLVLGEGGFSIQNLWHGNDVHAIAVAEKGCLELECTADSNGRHSSIVSGDSPTTRLVNALSRVLKREMHVRLTPATRAFLEGLAAAAQGPARFLLRLPVLKTRLTARHLSRIPAVNAMLRDTIALTVIESGMKSNMAPAHARGILNIRLLPGSDPDSMLEIMRRELGKDGVQVRRLPSHTQPANYSDFQTEEFTALAKHAIGKKGNTVVPILSPGASDGRHFRCAGIKCYGWVPFPISHDDLIGVHGPNERVAIKSFEQGLRNLYYGVREMVS